MRGTRSHKRAARWECDSVRSPCTCCKLVDQSRIVSKSEKPARPASRRQLGQCLIYPSGFLWLTQAAVSQRVATSIFLQPDRGTRGLVRFLVGHQWRKRSLRNQGRHRSHNGIHRRSLAMYSSSETHIHGRRNGFMVSGFTSNWAATIGFSSRGYRLFRLRAGSI